jgi:hypothetical protein
MPLLHHPDSGPVACPGLSGDLLTCETQLPTWRRAISRYTAELSEGDGDTGATPGRQSSMGWGYGVSPTLSPCGARLKCALPNSRQDRAGWGLVEMKL